MWDTPEQTHSRQPSMCDSDKSKVPSRQRSHCEPSTFVCKKKKKNVTRNKDIILCKVA